MHRNRRSLLDYAPAEPKQNDHAYASENRYLRHEATDTQPQQKRGLKSIVDVFSIRQKIQEKMKPDESSVKPNDIAEQSHHSYAPIQVQSTQDNFEQREYYHNPDKPLLDFVAIITSIWQRKYLIVVFALIAGGIGAFVALSTPHTYYAESEIFLDPRELRLTETDLSNNPVSSELLLALVDTQMRVATSTTVLENTIDELGLVNDPEFNGNTGGISTFIKELFSSSSRVSKNVDRQVLDQLRKSVGVGRGAKTLVVSLGVSTLNADKSALIANSLVEQFLKEYSLQKSGFFNQTSTSIQGRLDVLGKRLDEAENAVVRYRSANDIIDVGGGVINQKEMLSLSDSLTKIRADQIAKSILAKELSSVDVNAVISGSFPQAALTTTLSELRKQYSVAKSTSNSLAVGLGQRHPQLVAAQASAKALESDIRDELRRIIAAAQRDAKRTQQSEAELSSQLAVLKSRSSDQSVENIELEELTRKANSLRTLYEQLLRSSSETAVQGELASSKIQVISRAEAPEIPSSTSRKITVILFAFAGGMLGIIYAMIIGAWRGIQQNYTSRPSVSNRDAMSQENIGGSDYEQNPSPENSASYQRQQEPAMQAPSHVAHNSGHAMNGTQNHVPVQVPAQAQAHPQAYADPRMVPVAAYQAPMPQAFYVNGQPAPMYPNAMPHPAAAQHVYVQPTDQNVPQPNVEPHAQQGMSPTQQNDTPEGVNSAEYKRLQSEVQQVRSRLENWVNQNNPDVKSR